MAQSNSSCLRLNSFEKNIKTSWKELQMEEDFCDVTLACEDKLVKTHTFIISSCSSVLRSILKKNPIQNMVIYLRSVKSKDLENLLTFMYQGEVDVAAKDLPSFLEVAEDLNIRGLSTGNQESCSLEKRSSQFNEMNNESKLHKINQVMCKLEKKNSQSIYQKIASSPKHLTLEESEMSFISADLSGNNEAWKNEHFNNDNERSRLFEKTENHNKLTVENSVNFESIDGKKEKIISCENCDKKFISNHGLVLHTQSTHLGIKYSCDKCNYKGTQKGLLRQHIKSFHEGQCYPCDQCQYKSARKDKLKEHVISVHEGKRYPCSQCDYTTPRTDKLKNHILSKHDAWTQAQ